MLCNELQFKECQISCSIDVNFHKNNMKNRGEVTPPKQKKINK